MGFVFPSEQVLDRRKQISFVEKAKSSTHVEDSPLQKDIEMEKDFQFLMGQYIKDLEAFGSDPVDEVLKKHCRVYCKPRLIKISVV